ncbi:MAG: nucleotidyltransferase domain-containing protein [Spirochaetes bacterium]|nr:nucleotidyltransferase domain-containing protein [Spirochaetota bacterium]
MLSDIFIKSPEQKILSLFAMNPDQSFYLRQISRRLNISLGAVHGALLILEENGILVSQDIGKTKIFKLERSNFIIKIFKTLNTLLILEPLIHLIKENSSSIILYGSYSTGTFTTESDLDLFIVSEEKENIKNLIESFSRKTDLEIRPIIMNLVERIKLENEDPEFYNEINHGITLWEKPIDERGF